MSNRSENISYKQEIENMDMKLLKTIARGKFGRRTATNGNSKGHVSIYDNEKYSEDQMSENQIPENSMTFDAYLELRNKTARRARLPPTDRDYYERHAPLLRMKSDRESS